MLFLFCLKSTSNLDALEKAKAAKAKYTVNNNNTNTNNITNNDI